MSCDVFLWQLLMICWYLCDLLTCFPRSFFRGKKKLLPNKLGPPDRGGSYGTIWYRMVPYGTVWYRMVPYGTVWYHMVPLPPRWGPQPVWKQHFFSERWPLKKKDFTNVKHLRTKTSTAFIYKGILIIWHLEKNRSEILTILASESLKTDNSVASYATCWFKNDQPWLAMFNHGKPWLTMENHG